MKTALYFFLCSMFILSCQKNVTENKDLNKLNADILFLLKKTDSLSSSIALNIYGISRLSNKIDSLNNQLTIVQSEVKGLKEQLQSPGADIAFLTKKLDALIIQYSLILEAIDKLISQISYSPGSISFGLEAFFPFRNNIKNYSDYKINVTSFGGALTKDRFDEPNSAYQLNGKTDFILTDYEGILGSSKRTLTFWARLDLSNNNRSGMAAVSWGPGTDGHRFDGYFNFDSIGPTANIGGSAITYQTPFKINNNSWHHYVYLIDSDNPKVNNIKIYQDGVLLTNRLAEYDLTLNVNTKEGDPLKIGKCSAPNDPSFFKGAVDEIRIYSRVLSDIEIKYLATH
jgi:hypothetical protein